MTDTKTPAVKTNTPPAKPKVETPAKPKKSSSKVVWILLGIVVLILLCCTVSTLVIRVRRAEWFENWREGITSRRTDNTDDLDTDIEEIDEEDPEEPAEFDDLWFDDTVDEPEEVADTEEDEDEPEDIPEEEEIDPPVPPSELRFPDFMPVGSVTLIWNDNSHNEDGFRIQRMSGPTRVVGQDVTQVTYSDDPECGETYRYRVYGYNDGGKSPYSNVLVLEGRCP